MLYAIPCAGTVYPPRSFSASSEATRSSVAADSWTCAHAIRTIPALVYDEHRPEDVNTNGEDHVADEVRYLLMSLPALKLCPQALRRGEPLPEAPIPFDDWSADFG